MTPAACRLTRRSGPSQVATASRPPSEKKAPPPVKIASAWVLTLPASMLLAGVLFLVFRAMLC